MDAVANLEMEAGKETSIDLQKIAVQLQKCVSTIDVAKEERTFSLDPHGYPEILTRHYQNGEFAFWGEYKENGLPFNGVPGKLAIVKNIRIPEKLRGKGIGTKLVDTWESAMTAKGVHTFAATNLKDEKAVKFWQSRGYAPLDESQPIPYMMVKSIKSA